MMYRQPRRGRLGVQKIEIYGNFQGIFGLTREGSGVKKFQMVTSFMNVPHLIAVFNSPLHSVFWTKMTTFENAIHSNPPPPIFFRPICIDIRNPNFFSNFSDFLKRRQILVDFVIRTESHFTFKISKPNKCQEC